MNRAITSPRFLMHWPTWIMTIALLWIMGLITLSGIDADANDSERKINQGIVQTYGWPLEFQRSQFLDRINIRPIPLFGEVYYFNGSALAIDLAVLFAVVGLSGWMTERHWRRRRWSLSIFELLVVCGVIALVLGWYQMHRQQRLNEARGLQALEALGEKVHFEISSYRDEPKWLVRLVGRKGFFPLFHSVGTITLHSSPKTADEALSLLANFREARYVEVNRYLVCPAFVKLVSDMPYLHHLSLNYSVEAPSEPSRLTGSFLYPYSHYLTPSQLKDSVAQIENDSNLFEQINQLDSLETLNLVFPIIELSTWNNIPSLTKLADLRFSGDLLIEDLSKLEEFPALKYVHANVIATKLEIKNFNFKHPQLVLGYSQSVTPITVAFHRLQRMTGSQTLLLERQNIDLAGVPLDEKTLAMLEPVDLKELLTLKVGAATSPAALAKLIKRCSMLEELDLSKLQFSKVEIDQLNLPKIEWLTIQQGALTVSDFIELEKTVLPGTLTILNTAFSDQDIAELEKEWPNAYLDIFDGDEEDLSFKALGNQDILPGKQITLEVSFDRDDD